MDQPINKLFYIAISLFFCHLSTAQTSLSADELLTEMVEERGIVGITAGYAVNGQTIWSDSKGYSCSEDRISFSADVLTRIASIAKPMTALAVMQLVEKKMIDLDQPIQSYLPAYPEKPEGAITTRYLLSHTSGIPQYKSAAEAENTIHYASLLEASEVFKDRDLLFEPGTDFFYSTYGYVVLGRIIEAVSGLSYEEYMQKNIWDLADMTDTGIEKVDVRYEDKSCLYHKKRKKPKSAKQNDLSNRIPGGGFYSTLNDLIRFGNAIVEGRLVMEETLNEMTQPQYDKKEGNPYGFGWFLYGPKPQQGVVIGHSGEQTGSATQLMIIPKSKTVVVILANTSGTWKDVISLSAELIRISESNRS